MRRIPSRRTPRSQWSATRWISASDGAEIADGDQPAHPGYPPHSGADAEPAAAQAARSAAPPFGRKRLIRRSAGRLPEPGEWTAAERGPDGGVAGARRAGGRAPGDARTERGERFPPAYDAGPEQGAGG